MKKCTVLIKVIHQFTVKQNRKQRVKPNVWNPPSSTSDTRNGTGSDFGTNVVVYNLNWLFFFLEKKSVTKANNSKYFEGRPFRSDVPQLFYTRVVEFVRRQLRDFDFRSSLEQLTPPILCP